MATLPIRNLEDDVRDKLRVRAAQPDAAVQEWMARQDDKILVTTAVTVSEIMFGLTRLPDGSRKVHLELAFRAFVGPDGIIPVLDLKEDAATRSGQMRATRQSLGHPITLGNALIAGIANVTQSVLATRNVKDYADLGLTVVNPWMEL
ncbi:VapC Predicted nucleic acid-binding protein, contains PIN domain [Caulobacteraceae bacterium]